MRIAVLFDGAGLARLGLEQSGHDCVGFELDPLKHALSIRVGSGQCMLGDATTVDLSCFDAVWASPPCQRYSSARTQGEPTSPYADALLEWALAQSQIVDRVWWIENVIPQGKIPGWGTPYNAAQFLEVPIQNRNRLIGGRYKPPHTYRPYIKAHRGICPAITATEYKGCASDKRRASRYYGRRLTVDECAYHQGFQIPDAWREPQFGLTPSKWRQNLYEAIGNGVPVYMAKAFGDVYSI